MSLLITCDSRLNTDVFSSNSSSNFINCIPPIDCTDGSWHIALTFLKISLSGAETDYCRLLKIHVSEVAFTQGGDNILDSCVCEVLNTLKFPHLIQQPVYLPLRPIKLEQLHISVRNETLRQADLTQPCVMTFHVVRNIYPAMKILRTYSNIQADLFPGNTPLRYRNQLSTLFHENFDYTKWEIALESVIIDKEIIQRLSDSFNDADCLCLYTDIIKDQAIGDRACKLLTIIPIISINYNKEQAEDKNQRQRIISTFHYKPKVQIFIPIIKKDLEVIDVTISLDYAKKKKRVRHFDFTEEEKKCLVNVNFILRKL